MKLAAQITIAVWFICVCLRYAYLDIEGRNDNSLSNTENLIITFIVLAIAFTVFKFAGAFSEIF